MSATVRLENVTLSYQRHPAVHHVSGVFAPGSLTAVTGPNGAGKSTLLKGIAGIQAPEEGRIVIENAAPGGIAYLPQLIEIQRDFPISIGQMVALGYWSVAGGFARITQRQKTGAFKALETVGLQGFANRPISSLSAGQFQRALFARLLVQDAALILLDEPFTAIDADTTLALLRIIARWHEEKRTVICVLHDLEQIRHYFPECMLLARQCVAWALTAESLNPECLARARQFRAAWSPEADLCPQ